MLGFGWLVTDQVGSGSQDGVGVDVFCISEAARGNLVEAVMVRQGSEAWGEERSWGRRMLRQ